MWICKLQEGAGTLYEELYKSLKSAISNGEIASETRLPSKRALAARLGVSTITVENAYAQLIAEGFVVSKPRKGYFVASLPPIPFARETACSLDESKCKYQRQEKEEWRFDLSNNAPDPKTFPFSTWARLMREIVSARERELMTTSPAKGVFELRKAIAEHLAAFRGMTVDPEQIVVGAGSEYLYSLTFQLFGRNAIAAIENPCHRKIAQVYQSLDAKIRFIEVDENGMNVSQLTNSDANVAHLSPTNQFPTGAVMPISRRRELLAWVNKEKERWILEDDYDSEFRYFGRPIPTLQSIDSNGKVLYMNTFSKSLASTIRIGYVVLPESMSTRFAERLGFYSNTVSTFEQYALAEFIHRGSFERLLNRRRLHYSRVRTQIIANLKASRLADRCKLSERDAGLHFLLQLKTDLDEDELNLRLKRRGIKLTPISDFYRDPKTAPQKTYLLCYSNLDPEVTGKAFDLVGDILQRNSTTL